MQRLISRTTPAADKGKGKATEPASKNNDEMEEDSDSDVEDDSKVGYIW